MARLVVRLLGPMQVTLDGERVTGFESDKVRALLAYLCVEADRPQRRERLAGLLWPERTEQSARTNLRVALANLRTVVGDRAADPPFLHVTPRTIHFSTAGDTWVDALAFAYAVETGGIPLLEQASELYGGDFLDGFTLPGSAAFEEWMVLTRERLARQVRRALAQLARHYERQGLYEPALHHIRRHVVLDAWDERSWRRLMRLLAATGQRNEALAQYDALRQTLASELGVEPEDATAALYRRIRDGGQQAPPPPRGESNLPAALTPFVGRRAELAAIVARLEEPGCRVLTLLGSGGSGKTRLALEAARRFVTESNATRRSRPMHGAFFVALAPLRTLADVTGAIADALGIAATRGQRPEQQVVDHVRGRRLLLVLDNFEHLLPPATPGGDEIINWLVALLHAAPHVRMLVTSRTRLDLQAESLFPVTGMGVPGTDEVAARAAEYDGVALFVEGARRVLPDFELGAGNAPAVAAICRAVGGLPLAILLAAACVDRMEPSEIACRLADGGGESVELLSARWRDVPDRQRSMGAVFDHSWSLLTPQLQAICRDLSVFRDGFTQAVAAAVTGAQVRDLNGLVHHSLLAHSPRDRYEMHELLRHYLAARLASNPAALDDAQRRHATYFAAALERWTHDLTGEAQESALAGMELDIQNAATAWQWLAARGQVEELARALDGLCLFYERRVRYAQGEAACRLAAGCLEVDWSGTAEGSHLLGRLLAWQGLFAHYLEGSDLAQPLLDRAMAALDDPLLAGHDTRAARAHAWCCQGRLWVSRQRDAARTAYERSVALYRSLGDRWGEANALAALGGVAWNVGDYGTARRYHQESLAIRQALGDSRGVADSLMSVGVTALHQGEMEVAAQLVERGCALRQALGDRRGHADGLRHLGVTRLFSGEFDEAISLLEASLTVYRDLGFRFGLEVAMLGEALLHVGQFEAAQARAAEALDIARTTGYRRGIGYALLVLGELALARGAFEEADTLLAESVSVYREIEQWDEGCRALTTRAYALRGLGRAPWVPPDLLAALRVAVKRGAFLPLLWALPCLCLLLSEGGQEAAAAHLQAEAACYPALARSAWVAGVIGLRLDAASTTPTPARPHALPAIVGAALEDL